MWRLLPVLGWGSSSPAYEPRNVALASSVGMCRVPGPKTFPLREAQSPHRSHLVEVTASLVVEKLQHLGLE